MISLFMTAFLLPTGCVLENKFANDPIQWSFLSGDGTWDSNSRRWTVYLRPGETKSVIIELYNSSSIRTTVNVHLGGPPDTIVMLGGGRYLVLADGRTDITLTAIAYAIAAPGSHRYTIDCSNSDNMIEP